MAERPWMKWYPSDWRADPALRMCGLAARGLWIDLLGLMHEGSQPGHLLVNGRAPTPAQIAVLVGSDAKSVSKALSELEEAGVFSRGEAGAIVSRRMVRDAERSGEGNRGGASRWGESTDAATTRSQRLAEARRKGRHTPEEWQAMLEVFGHHCVRCGADHTTRGGIVRDHILPIYKGGSDAIDNLQPLCTRCNAAKGPEETDHRDKARPDWRERLKERLAGQAFRTPEMPKAPADGSHQTPTQKPEARSQKDPSPASPPNGAGATADVRPPMPSRSDLPDRWYGLADRWEVTEGGVREPVCNGTFIRLAADQLLDAAGINDANWRGDWRPLVAWLRDGIDFHSQILPAVRSVASRPGYRPPRSLAYFDAAVREQRRVA